ncbi:MAG TPA: hypothetical protein VGN57_10975 [Pirellulaceae bacterium]|jgi:hypothetical protein|nr:hypothetical protein [Pirellulaceae bacterium]
MSRIVRREALMTIGGGGLAALLSAGTTARGEALGAGGALVQATLELSHREGRRLTGFVETGVAGGIALSSLVRQDPANPAVQSVFAEPAREGGRDGVRITVAFYSEPVGSISTALLHVPLPDSSATA